MIKSDLVQLKYLSRAPKNLNVDDLAKIVDASKAQTEPHGITGILFFDKGYYGQILEGERVAVEATWSRIKNDTRHSEIELIGVTEIQARRFPMWSMKLFDTQEFAETFPQFAELIAKMVDPEAEDIRILKLLWQRI